MISHAMYRHQHCSLIVRRVLASVSRLGVIPHHVTRGLIASSTALFSKHPYVGQWSILTVRMLLASTAIFGLVYWFS